jgi:hypothetical protein
MNEEELIEKNRVLLAEANSTRDAIDHHACFEARHACHAELSKALLRDIYAELNAVQFELLLRLTYRRFCKLFGI